MRVIGLCVFFLSFSACAKEPISHCSGQEQVIFSCSIAKSAKVVSLCSSKQLGKGKGSLVYRFGVPGKVELEYPSSSNNSLQRFVHVHYSRFQTDRTEVSFSIGKFRYSVFDYYEEDAKPKNTQGVTVTNASGRETQLLCAGTVQSTLQKLEGVIPCDTESAMASCK